MGNQSNIDLKLMENPQTSHGRDGRIILLISWLLFFYGLHWNAFPDVCATERLYASGQYDTSPGFCRQPYRRIEATCNTILDPYKLSDGVLPSDSSEARDEAGLVGGVFGSLRRSWVSRRSRRKLLRRSHLLPRHPADATPGSTP